MSSPVDTFLLACDSSPIKKTLTTNWEDSSKRTKSDYILKAKQICSNVLNVLAPGQGHHLLEAIVQSEKSQDYNLLDDVTAAYKSCTDWGTQRQILSLVATKVAFVKLKTLIPNLSRYKFCAARKHALSFGEGQQVPSAELTREGISTQQISHFLDFLLSPAIITDMPYGETKLKLSNGESINVPKVILNSVRTRVVEQYFSYCEETGFDKKASLSTYMRILHAVGPNVRKSMKGLDNYAADGAKAIENLQKVVELFGRLGQGKEWTENATNVLSVTKQYLKLEYKLHIMKDSEVADHCCKYALSDGTKYYSSACSHSHESSCKQCDDLEMVLENISDISTKIVYDDDDQKDDTVYIVSESVRAVYEWKKHVLRTVNQDMARQLILDELQDTEVLIERDWAMKFIPMMYRESQTNWFGKRGLNWHVTVATFKNESILNSYTIIHIFDSATQDAETSNAVLSNSLEMLHVLKSSLNTAFIRSDNAGCFHGTVSLCAVPNLSVDIHYERVDFADPQGGKSICDRKAAHTKSYIRRYVNEGNDVCTASDFKKAIQSSKMKNVSVVVSLPPTKRTKKFPVIFKLPKVTELNNFSFTHNGTIRVWKQYDIGEGLVIPANGSQLELPKLTIIEQYSSDVTIQDHAGDHTISEASVDNSILSTDFNTDIQLEEEEEPAEMSGLFCCTECTKTFSRHGNLLRHLDIGTHLVKTENKCLSDKSKVEYSKQIEKLNTTKVNLQNFTAKTSKSKLKEGWALKARREVKRFNKNQTDFLDEKFDKGEKTGQKCDPEDVSQEMRQVKRNSIKRFRQDEFLSATQIASYFSRLVVKKRQSYNPLYTEDDLQAEISATEFQELQEIAK